MLQLFNLRVIILSGILVGIVSCQKESVPASETDAASPHMKTTTGLVQGPPPILWWSSLGVLPYTDPIPGDQPIEEQYSQGFAINGHGFICGTLVTSSQETNSATGVLFEYDPTTRGWIMRSAFPDSLGYLEESTNFVIGDNAYIVAGNHTWQYNQPTDTWTQKANVSTINNRWGATSFAVNGKGYFGLGINYGYVPPGGDEGMLDWWQYDPVSNTWASLQNFPGTRRSGAAGFAVDGKGYVATGSPEKNVDAHTVWQYDPGSDHWTRKADFPGPSGDLTFGENATIGGVDIGFLVGNGGVWEYNPATDVWGQAQNMPGGAKWAPGGFVLGNSLIVADLSAVALNWSR